MRTTIVPAQITSVEDKIAGNLSFSQLMLLIVPLFLSVAMYILLPPFGGFHAYKAIIAGMITAICLLLAIRFRGKLIAQWLGVRIRYNLRPRYYVFNKNCAYSRAVVNAPKERKQDEIKPVGSTKPLPKLQLLPKEMIAFESATNRSGADFQFVRSKKGGLSVRIKELR